MTTLARKILAIHLETATGQRIKAPKLVRPAAVYLLLLAAAVALLIAGAA